MKKILVIGCHGFTGRHLLPLLQRQGEWEIYGAGLEAPAPVEVEGFFRCSVTEAADIRAALQQCRPDYVINLAGSFSLRKEHDFAVNVDGPRNILEALISLGLKDTRTLLIGSSAEYGPGKEGVPLREDDPLNPQNVYGESKVAQSKLLYEYQGRLPIMLARSFNLIGRWAPPALFSGAFFEKVKAFQNGEIRRLDLLDLSAYRDYLDIRDAVHAYMTLLQRGKAGEIYNVARGIATPVLDIVKFTQECLQIPPELITYKATGEGRGVAYQVGAIDKIKELDWQPRYILRESVAYILEHLGE